MTVRIEKDGPVWTVIHSRPEARNAMDPKSAKAIYEAFKAQFDEQGRAIPDGDGVSDISSATLD